MNFFGLISFFFTIFLLPSGHFTNLDQACQGFSIHFHLCFAVIKITTMSVNILTKEDLVLFQDELLKLIKALLSQSPVQTKRWLKTEEVKDVLKVSASTLQTLRINGTLTYSKLGGIIYYDYEHIEKVLKENLRLATKT